MKGLQMNSRGSGRTKRMVEAIPCGQAARIIVHTPPMRDYVRRMVADIHGADAPIVVMVVRTPDNVSYALDGWSGNVAVDHAFWDMAGTQVVDMVRQRVEYFAAKGLYVEAE